MKSKLIKLSPKKDGYGNISSYTISIGSNEARECGFIDLKGNILQIEKILDHENHQIIIQVKTAD